MSTLPLPYTLSWVSFWQLEDTRKVLAVLWFPGLVESCWDWPLLPLVRQLLCSRAQAHPQDSLERVSGSNWHLQSGGRACDIGSTNSHLDPIVQIQCACCEVKKGCRIWCWWWEVKLSWHWGRGRYVGATETSAGQDLKTQLQWRKHLSEEQPENFGNKCSLKANKRSGWSRRYRLESKHACYYSFVFYCNCLSQTIWRK